jgi:hypothetical protein
MPLAEDCGGVTDALEHLAHGEGARRERIYAARNGNERQAIAD